IVLFGGDRKFHLSDMTYQKFRFCAFVALLSLCALSSAAPSLPIPTAECQRWCPSPGSEGNYQCCDDDFCALAPDTFCTLAIICGSDGVLYNNGCAFEGARCRNPALQQGDSCYF
ncbi:unnamed protein product, partial [Meganyctiphanes norvegica]